MKKLFFSLTLFFLMTGICIADETNSPITTTLNASTYTAITMVSTAPAKHCKSVSAYTEDGTAWHYATDASGTDTAKITAGMVPNFGCNKETSIVFYARADSGTPVLVTFVGAPQ